MERANVIPLHTPAAAPAERPRWRLAELSGRLVEIAGRGAATPLTAAIGLVVEAQRAGEPVAWVAAHAATFYPPDAADAGVDLAALPVVRVSGARAAARAADHLVRSGAFALVVVDLGARAAIPMAMQGRLVGLAQRHHAAIVCLTDTPADAPSLGSMVSLRAVALRQPAGRGRFRCKLAVVKDKRRGPGWSHAEVVRGPAGLR
ncbi:MAG: recombinase A [Deltaproteobacteria bacterium]|nr:MAG: recombinase A [Deltaproteobacteria bacterium]